MTFFFPNLALLQIPAPLNGLLGPIFMYGAIFAIFYFILIRPGQQQRKQQDLLIRAVKKGDEVVTTGGVVGDVIFIKETVIDGKNQPNEDRITIKSGESRLIIERGRIARVSRSGGGSSTASQG
ncbi:MAG: preprotein translocase subunit YajC [Thermoanaerobaculia bacterium]